MIKKTFKVGLDIHGVIDVEPILFHKITKTLKEIGCEIHILTGSHITSEITSLLESNKIHYDVLFSISDYHRKIGTHMWYDSNSEPWVDDLEWDKTKGEYCERNNIDLHIDDTKRYGDYFKTKFMHLNLNGHRKDYKLEKLNTISDIEKWFNNMFLKENELIQ
jgi:hypothetical protein